MYSQSSPPKFQTLRVIFALMVREMNTRYGRSYGGYFWALAEPVGTIAVLSLAFSQFLRTPALGDSFMLFYASGYVPYQFFMSLSQQVGTSVAFNKNLMYFPMVTPLDAVISRTMLGLLTLTVVTLIVFTGILSFLPEPVAISLPEIMIACAATSILGVGTGTMNSVLFAFAPTWKNVWGIITRPLFIISGIFFTYESMPSGVQALLIWNPLVHAIGKARQGFYPIYDGAYIQIWYPISIGVFCFLLGGVLLIRHRSFVVENSGGG